MSPIYHGNPPSACLPVAMEILFDSVLSKKEKTHLYTLIRWCRVACCMAFLGSYTQLNLWFLTLTSNCLSQTSPWTKGTHSQSCVHMGRTYKHVCPVQAIVSYLATQDHYSSWVFTLLDGRMLTSAQNLKNSMEAWSADTPVQHWQF